MGLPGTHIPSGHEQSDEEPLQPNRPQRKSKKPTPTPYMESSPDNRMPSSPEKPYAEQRRLTQSKSKNEKRHEPTNMDNFYLYRCSPEELDEEQQRPKSKELTKKQHPVRETEDFYRSISMPEESDTEQQEPIRSKWNPRPPAPYVESVASSFDFDDPPPYGKSSLSSTDPDISGGSSSYSPRRSRSRQWSSRRSSSVESRRVTNERYTYSPLQSLSKPDPHSETGPTKRRRNKPSQSPPEPDSHSEAGPSKKRKESYWQDRPERALHIEIELSGGWTADLPYRPRPQQRRRRSPSIERRLCTGHGRTGRGTNKERKHVPIRYEPESEPDTGAGPSEPPLWQYRRRRAPPPIERCFLPTLRTYRAFGNADPYPDQLYDEREHQRECGVFLRGGKGKSKGKGNSRGKGHGKGTGNGKDTGKGKRTPDGKRWGRDKRGEHTNAKTGQQGRSDGAGNGRPQQLPEAHKEQLPDDHTQQLPEIHAQQLREGNPQQLPEIHAQQSHEVHPQQLSEVHPHQLSKIRTSTDDNLVESTYAVMALLVVGIATLSNRLPLETFVVVLLVVIAVIFLVRTVRRCGR